jgi:hypothetical protein
MMADTAPTARTWSTAELEQIASRDELDVAPRRGDGTLTKPRIVWMVRVGDDVYVRSVKGTEGSWYRTTRGTGEGHVSTGTVDKDVAFLDVVDSGDTGSTDDTDDTDGSNKTTGSTDNLQDRIDAAYRAKYSRYPGPVASITADKARATTMRLVPR